MSEATLTPAAPISTPEPVPAPAAPTPAPGHALDSETIGDLLERLGGVAPSRVLLRPWPGTATEADVIAIEARENRLCELIDGVLVEKCMGYSESRMGAELIVDLGGFLRGNDLGVMAGADGMLRLKYRRVRIPDVSFISWARIPDPKELDQPIPDLVPDLAVEILSPSNTKHEMAIKLREYFAAGVRLVWYVDPPARTARAFTSPETWTDLGPDDTLDGGDVLPGFRLAMSEWFDRAERKGPRPTAS
jgi:Uma2 family endonuclease